MKSLLFFLITAIILASITIYPQTSREKLKETKLKIDSLLSKNFNGQFQRVDEIVNIDSSIGKAGISGGNISDPYGTLKNCILFIVRMKGENGQYEIGIMRNNQIIWMSGPLPGSEYYADYMQGDQLFLAVNDINNTGNVDMIVYFSGEGTPSQDNSLWIYKWDGTSGECLNQREDNGGTSLVSSCSFKIEDINGNGIKEILACDENNIMDIAYSWNGSLYGKWSDSPNLTGKSFTVADNLTANITTDVIEKNNSFRYTYIIENGKNSRQGIGSFYVKVNTDSLQKFIFPVNWSGGEWLGHQLFDCFTEEDSSLIMPGLISDSIGFTSIGLPSISRFYVQSISHKLNYDSMDPDSLDTMYYNNVLSNSYSNFTLGASDPPSHFVPVDFLDTLVSYKHRAANLGWINNQGIENRLDSKLDNAKKKLAAGDSTAAVNILNAFVNEVEAQKGKHLSSEAYALLKYNADYLISRLK